MTTGWETAVEGTDVRTGSAKPQEDLSTRPQGTTHADGSVSGGSLGGKASDHFVLAKKGGKKTQTRAV